MIVLGIKIPFSWLVTPAKFFHSNNQVPASQSLNTTDFYFLLSDNHSWGNYLSGASPKADPLAQTARTLSRTRLKRMASKIMMEGEEFCMHNVKVRSRSSL